MKPGSGYEMLVETIAQVRAVGKTDPLSNSIPEWVAKGQIKHVSGLEDLELPLFPSREGLVFSNSSMMQEITFSNEDDWVTRDSQGNPYEVQPDVLAWYSSFRNRDWGIYIRVAGIDVVASELTSSLITPSEARKIAFEFLFEHEFTHFRTDLAVAGIELLTKNVIWSKWRASLTAKNPHSLTSEGLCNSHAFYKVPKHTRADLAKWLSKCPPGYSDYAQHLNTQFGRHESWSNLLSEITGAGGGSFSPYQPNMSYLRKLVPVYLVHEKSQNGSQDPDTVYFLGAMQVTEGPKFAKSLSKTGNAAVISKQWQKVKGLLQQGDLTPGLNLEHYSAQVFTVRLTQQTRAILQRINDQWLAVEVSQQHDAINKRASHA